MAAKLFLKILITKREALRVTGKGVICRGLATENVDFCVEVGVVHTSLSSDKLEQPGLRVTEFVDNTKSYRSLLLNS